MMNHILSMIFSQLLGSLLLHEGTINSAVYVSEGQQKNLLTNLIKKKKKKERKRKRKERKIIFLRLFSISK